MDEAGTLGERKSEGHQFPGEAPREQAWFDSKYATEKAGILVYIYRYYDMFTSIVMLYTVYIYIYIHLTFKTSSCSCFSWHWMFFDTIRFSLGECHDAQATQRWSLTGDDAAGLSEDLLQMGMFHCQFGVARVHAGQNCFFICVSSLYWTAWHSGQSL